MIESTFTLYLEVEKDGDFVEEIYNVPFNYYPYVPATFRDPAEGGEVEIWGPVGMTITEEPNKVFVNVPLNDLLDRWAETHDLRDDEEPGMYGYKETAREKAYGEITDKIYGEVSEA